MLNEHVSDASTTGLTAAETAEDRARRFVVSGKSAITHHRSRPRVVGCKGEMDLPELVEHLAQIASPAINARDRIMPVRDAKVTGRTLHQLRQSCRASGADSHWIDPRSGPDQCLQQSYRTTVPKTCTPALTPLHIPPN